MYCAQIERLWRDSKLLEIGGGTNEAPPPPLVLSGHAASITPY